MERDYLRLLGMAFHAYHGLQQEEIENGQRFEVDVELQFDAAPAGLSDHISDTIDVREIYALVRRVVMERRFFLIEAVAEHIAAEILERFPAGGVRVRVRKPFAPLGGPANGSEIEITRHRREVQSSPPRP